MDDKSLSPIRIEEGTLLVEGIDFEDLERVAIIEMLERVAITETKESIESSLRVYEQKIGLSREEIVVRIKDGRLTETRNVQGWLCWYSALQAWEYHR